MTEPTRPEDSVSSLSLRGLAERILRDQPWDDAELAELSTRELIHELRVYQVELDTQNQELRRAQTDLAESRDAYLDLYDRAPVGYLTLDRDALVREANLTVATFLGVSRESLIGRPFLRFLTPEAIGPFYAHLRAAITGEGPRESEVLLNRADGARFWARLDSVGVSDEESPEVRWRTTMTDISARRQAQEEAEAASERVRQSEERFRRVVDGSSAGYIRLDWRGRIERVNEAWLRMHGYSSEDEVVGRSFTELVMAPGDEGFVAEAAGDLLEGKPLLSGELRRRCKDGSIGYERFSSQPIFREGEVVAVESFIIDTTEAHHLEEQLRQARKMETVGQLAGGVAHYYNNFLTGIIGAAEVVLGSLSPDHPAQEDLRLMLEAAERAGDLTSQLLSFSRRQMLMTRLMNPNQIVERVARMLRYLVPDGVELAVVPDPDPWSIKVDAAQVEQALIALVVNAVEAMPDGGVVTVRVERAVLRPEDIADWADAVPGEYVYLRVSDTGVGLSEEVKKHLFEPFFTTKGLGEGTGLGLASAYGIAKQHGGHLTANSTPGQGATFDLYFPRTAGAPSKTPVPETPTVIVAEDDEVVREVVTRMARIHGYTVVQAADGEEALDLGRKHAAGLQLLITDVVMPGLGGAELARRLRGLKPDLKVLYISGYSEDPRPDLESEPGTDVLRKPFSSGTLAKAIRGLVVSG